jgi:hypothetical protein
MSYEEGNVTRPTSVLGLRLDWPRLRLPIFFIVDDPAPCLNLAYYEQYFAPHVRDVPNSFTAAWTDVVEEFGMRGKFSVLPVPAGIGRIDRPLPDVRPADQEEFLQIIRERVSPLMDICIEFLTHFQAWDLKRERPVDYTEKTMGPHTNRGHLTDYFAYGLRILKDVGLQPTGATSPGASCREIEWAYQGAIRDAVRDVCGLPIAWFFCKAGLPASRISASPSAASASTLATACCGPSAAILPASPPRRQWRARR